MVTLKYSQMPHRENMLVYVTFVRGDLSRKEFESNYTDATEFHDIPDTVVYLIQLQTHNDDVI